MKKLLLALCLVLTFGVGLKAQLPSVSLKNLEGKSINTAQLVDGKYPLIISFFATWCKPCLRELTAIADEYEDWQEETGVRLIAVSIDAGADTYKVKPLVKSKDWTYEVLLDANSEFKRAMNVMTVPTVFVLDPKGEIIYRHTSYTMGDEEELIAKLREIKK